MNKKLYSINKVFNLKKELNDSTQIQKIFPAQIESLSFKTLKISKHLHQ